jgi:MarR family protein
MSLLDQVRKLEQQVVDRLKELEPLTREYEQLRAVAQRLGLKYSPGSGGSDGGVTPATTAGGRGEAGAGKPAATSAKPRTDRSAARARRTKAGATARGMRSTRRQRPASRATAARAGETAAPSPARKRADSRGQRSGGRRAAPARPGQRDDEVLRHVAEGPGITVREIGERLGVEATGLYRVVKRLTDSGRVLKDGPRLYPVEGTAAPAPAPVGDGTSQPPTGAEETREATVPATPDSSTRGAQTGASRDS